MFLHDSTDAARRPGRFDLATVLALLLALPSVLLVAPALADLPAPRRDSAETPMISFTEEGALTSQLVLEQVLNRLGETRATHLVVFVHGWNNSRQEAGESYRRFSTLLDEVAQSQRVAYRPFYLGVHWPSKRWDDDEDLSDVGERRSESQQDLADSFAPAVGYEQQRLAAEHAAFLTRLARREEAGGPLTPAERNRAMEILALHAYAPFDADEASLFEAPSLLDTLQDQATAPGAERLPNRSLELAEGSFSFRDTLRVFTFWQMKKRAGIVGRRGLFDMLAAIQRRMASLSGGPRPKLCLLGHSFGCKAILSAVASETAALPAPVDAIALIQPAISHVAFAPALPNARQLAGGYRSAIAGPVQRVRGPIVLTFTTNDVALTRYYPLGARIGRDIGELSELAERAADPSPYSALGSVGAFPRGVNVGSATIEGFVDLSRQYPFSGPGLYSVHADAFVSDHSEYYNHAAAWLALNVFGATTIVPEDAGVDTRPVLRFRASSGPQSAAPTESSRPVLRFKRTAPSDRP